VTPAQPGLDTLRPTRDRRIDRVRGVRP